MFLEDLIHYANDTLDRLDLHIYIYVDLYGIASVALRPMSGYAPRKGHGEHQRSTISYIQDLIMDLHGLSSYIIDYNLVMKTMRLDSAISRYLNIIMIATSNLMKITTRVIYY